MPSLSKDITAAAGRVQSIVTIPIDATKIKAASAVSITEGISPVSTYAEIGIMAGGELYANRVAVLAQGYIGSGSSIGWTGEIKGDGEQYLYLSLRAHDTSTYRLTLLSEKN